jgi:hypothetical protein
MIVPVGRSVHRMGWMIVLFSFAFLPYVNQHSATVNLFWLLIFDHLFFSLPILEPTLHSILPTHLVTLLT